MFGVGPPEVEEKAQVTSPDRVTPFGGALSAARPLRKVAPSTLRNWADNSEWPRAAINHRRVQVSQSEWGIVPIDPKREVDEALQAKIELLLLHPNNKQKTFRALIEPVIEDILVLDRGVIEKEITVAGEPTALHLVNGADIRTRPMWSGEPADPRYEWWPNNVFVSNMLDTQVILMMANPTSHRVDGISPLEMLKHTIDADLEARDFNVRAVRQHSPNGLLNLGENVGANVIDAFRAYWDAEVAGKKQMGIIGGVQNPEFIKMGQTARDMQYMQWQVYLLRKIAAVFGIAPQDLGITFDVNRANATTQQELSEDRGLKPLLRLIEEEMNSKVIADFVRTKARRMHARGKIDMATLRQAVALSLVDSRDHPDVFQKLHAANVLNMAFRFRLKSAKSTRDQTDHNRFALAGFPWRTTNEVRAEDGFQPVEGGDEIIVMTPIGAIPLAMIGGNMVPATEDQKRYLDGLFATAPLVLGDGPATNTGVVASTPPVAVPVSPEREEVPAVVTEEVPVDEDGDEVVD